MASVLEQYKAKKAAELAKGGAAPQINAPEAETKLANETQREVEGERQAGPDPSKSGSSAPAPAPASSPSTPDSSQPSPELTRGQKAAATRAAKKAAGGSADFSDLTTADLVAELFIRGYGVTKL